MVGRYAINKGTCFLTFSLAYFTILLFNNLTSSNSVKFISSGKNMEKAQSYGIIIDAGSSGSRLFIYKWSSPQSDQELINIRPVIDDDGDPVVKKVTPGLSTFADNYKDAPEYIAPLLEFASEHIPEERRTTTIVFIFATAGMRLLPLEKQNSIMEALRRKLPELTSLEILPENIKVITGKWEGIYSWIAVNYMLGRFNLSSLPADFSTVESNTNKLDETSEESLNGRRPKTAGMIDMGGASAQIAFELPLGRSQEEQTADENVEIVNLGSRDTDRRFLYRIFVTTFLGFGANEGAKKYEHFLWKQLEKANESAENIVPTVSDGCLPVNFLKLTYIEEEDKQFVRKGDGNWQQCVQDIATLIFDNFPNCPLTKSCFFGGIKAPPDVTLSQVELYGFSEYWYSVDDVLSLGGVYEHDKFEAKAQGFCQQTWRTIKKKVREKLYPKADKDRIETQCFKSAWIHAILHNGFYVDEMQNHFQSAFRINGQEVQWALGALIYQMRYFPLLGRHAQVERQMDNYDGYEWTLAYSICIAALLFLLWRIWYKQRHSQQKDGRKSYRYRRLERDNLEQSI